MKGLEVNDIIRALTLTQVEFTPEVMDAIAVLSKAAHDFYEACSDYGNLPLQAMIELRPLEYPGDDDEPQPAPVETPFYVVYRNIGPDTPLYFEGYSSDKFPTEADAEIAIREAKMKSGLYNIKEGYTGAVVKTVRKFDSLNPDESDLS